MELNEKLTRLRKENKLTQAQVAETLDVSRQAISNWETGTVLPSTDNLKSLSRLYQVPADSLLNDDTDPFACPAEKAAENANTNSKLSPLKKRRAIILVYLLTVILVVALSVGATLFVLWAREPKAIDLYDLDSIPVSELNIEIGEFL